MPNLREALVERNPWWKGEFQVAYRPRRIYDRLQKFQDHRQIIALTGLRRVGKTTLLLKLVQDALDGGTEPQAILYFAFDEFPDADLREVLRTYADLFDRDLRNDHHLILLDEIQKVEGWQDQLKALYDTYDHLKFIVSGSESLFIRQGARATLAGRLFEFQVDPLTFAEYLEFRNIPHQPRKLHEAEIRRAFEAYVPTQGFPELAETRDKDVIRKYVRESIVEKLVYRDLPTLLSLRQPGVLESILNILLDDPGQILYASDLAGELGVSRQTVAAYLSYLEQAFLIRKLYNYSTGPRKVERKLRKYYATVASVDLLFREDPASRGRALEWVIVNQLRAEYFWRDAQKNEVDIVVAGDPPLPIEVKSGRVRTRGIEAFLRTFDAPRGVVVTRDAEAHHQKDGRTIETIPAYKYLLRPPTDDER